MTSNVLLSALKLSQYRDYWKKWKGKKEFYTTNYQDEKEKFIDEYIEKHLKPFDLKKFKKEVIEDIKESEDIAEDIKNELRPNIKKYMKEAYNKWGFKKEFKYLTEKEFINSEDPVEEVLDYMIEHGIIEDSKIYQERLHLEETEHKADQINNLAYDANVEFNQLYGNKSSDKNKKSKGKRDLSNLYKDLFGGKFRLVLDINIDAADIASREEKNVTTKEKYNTAAIDFVLPYFISHYYKLLGKSEDMHRVQEVFLEKPVEARKNYTEGYYISPVTNTKISIGKMLNLIKTKDPEFAALGQYTVDEFNKVFNTRPAGFKGKIVISRHPYDIAGMSTDRGWDSCMNLVPSPNKENYSEYVEPTIMSGALIAYLAKEDDTNIKNPTSRLLIKPFVKKGEEMDFDNPNWILRVSDVYGRSYTKFMSVVQEWADKNWNEKILAKQEDGTLEFEFNTDLYKERSDKDVVSILK